MKNIVLSVILAVVIHYPICGQKDAIGELTDNGAWCWFSDPRAVYVEHENLIITGWVKNEGTVEAASFDPVTGKVQTKILYPQLEYDDHNNPAFLVLPDQHILAMYTWHSSPNGVLFNKTSAPLEVSSFGKAQVFKPKTAVLLEEFPKESYTYANPYMLAKEDNRIYSFGRWIGFKPNMVASDDGGNTWHSPRVIISPVDFDASNRPYVKYFSDGLSKIHMIYTDGHPRNEPFNALYYCYYEDGAFWRADGTKIRDVQELPFEAREGSLIYRPDEKSGRAWNADIVVSKDGSPIILYTRHPAEWDHRYHYVWYDMQLDQWIDHEICRAGKWFPQTPEGSREKEPHYFGNMTLHPAKPNTVYLSRQINGVFEIQKYTTTDGGNSWDTESITANSQFDNVRPYVPRGTPELGKTVVLWMENRQYIHYTDYDAAIKYWIDDE